PEDIYFYHLGISVTDRVYIGDSPYILPVAANAQYTLDYHLLVLNRENIRLFEGHGSIIEELPISEIENSPIDITEALATDFDDSSLNYQSYRGRGSGDSGATQNGAGHAFHGHRDLNKEKDIDRERYFRMVDDFVFEHFSNKLH